ncbi:RING finger protein 24 [Biomphalaria glabrata]|uniref:RING finger protein 24-like n=1 Tax=Biomphalaria glabrata TaxID=6526 RepID=A0A2C9L413_BIOGL|nr:RING finger protein 24-like [Biomphalaria glabrata]XP_013077190.1 RING finger protein 24-like [Biomphalaria glabrata]XP_055899778.1 RING finger protein 24-like [Biomphalaria glabrata]XP_055899783.1 RING finger protein 24-like [Biomphalaria glabrata]XP_055899790.1 RING finger protein 24-like [Biomphalaria glabrata]KAI8769425.1 RING finger protein 24-like [Biomphalaria glabrata]KAI8789753.1 RING finger protein 24 [Biomphalaria glabrata]
MEADQVPFNVSLPLLGVGAFTLLLSFCFCCYLWRLKKAGQYEEKGYVVKKFTFRDKHQQNDTCSVCLEEFKKGEKIAVCTCRHGFHSKCLEQWLEHKNNCPLCKAPVRNRIGERTVLISHATTSSV